MTAHKHLKSLVRSRMEKTGESYATARRQVVAQATSVEGSDSAGGGKSRRKADAGGAPNGAGTIAATTAMRIVLHAAGVRDASGVPLSEPLLFAIAGGIGIGVAQFFYEQAGVATIYLAGRHLWQDDEAYFDAAFDRLGVKTVIREASGAKPALAGLREAMQSGQPCVAWVDMAHLPHRALPPEFSGGGYHVVTVYDIDEPRGVARLGDLSDDPVEISLEDLATSRARIKKFKHRLLSVEAAGERGARSRDDLASAVRGGLQACARGLPGDKKLSPTMMFSLEGLAAWGERLHGGRGKDAWDKVFTPGVRLWGGLCSVYEYIERYGTGGGLCRPFFAEALREAARVCDLPELNVVAERYAKLGESWTGLADAALPAGVPLFKKARQAYEQRSEAYADGDVAGAKQSWESLARLKAEASDCFPLTEKQSVDLLKELQDRVRAIHTAEVEACKALHEAVE